MANPAPYTPDEIFELMGAIMHRAHAAHLSVANRIQEALTKSPEAAIELGVELGCISIRETALAICQASNIDSH